MIEPVAVGQVASFGSTVLQRFRTGIRLRLEATSTAETRIDTHGETHTITIDVRIFNVGIPVTVRRVSLIAKPTLASRILNRLTIIADAPETGFSMNPGEASVRSWRMIPAHVASGDFHMFKFHLSKVWPPEQLNDTRLAVWYGAARRPLLTRELPRKVDYRKMAPYGTLVSDVIESTSPPKALKPRVRVF